MTDNPQTREDVRECLGSFEAREAAFWKWWVQERQPHQNEAAAFHAGYLARHSALSTVNVDALREAKTIGILKGRTVSIEFDDEGPAFDLFDALNARWTVLSTKAPLSMEGLDDGR